MSDETKVLASFEVEEALEKAKAILMLLTMVGDQAVGYAAAAAMDFVEIAQADLGLLADNAEGEPA